MSNIVVQGTGGTMAIVGSATPAQIIVSGTLRGPKGEPGGVNTVNGRNGDVVLAKADVGLSNVDNTSDADKPVSNATQTALNAKVPTSRQVNGHALSSDVTITKADVGLGNVDNTSDANKPVSTAQQAALDLKASDIAIVHLAGAETVTGDKTFTGDTKITGLTPRDLKYALQFTGANGSNVSLGVKTYLDAKPFTFGVWVDFYNNTLADDGGVWGYGYSSGNNKGYTARVDGSTKKLTFFYGSTQVVANNTYCWGKMWLTLTYDGASTLNVYKNNVLMDTLTIASRTADAAIGSYLATRDGTARNLNGALDGAFLYNRVLTSAELTTIYRDSGNTSAYPTSGSIFLYHFDERTGTTATDSSGNGNNGTINSATYFVSPFGNPNRTPSVPAMFQAAISGADTAKTSAIFFGSSTTQGADATTNDNRYTDVLGRLWHKSFNDPAVIGGKNIRATDTGWTTTGTVSLNSEGLALNSHSMSAGATLSRTLTNCTGFDLYYVQGTGQGSFTVTIDGGTPVTITPSTTAPANRHDGTYTVTGLTRGSHTVLITATNACIINGLYIQDSDATTGVRIYNSGKGGTTVVDLLATDTAWTRVASLGNVSGIVMMFGSNDFSSSTDPATFKANLYTMIRKTWTNVSSSRPDIILVNSYRRFDQVGFGTVYTYDQYGTKMKELAAEFDRVYYVDIAELFPLVNDTAHDPLDLMNTDNIHMNDAGHKWMARILARALAPTASGVQGDTIIRADDSLALHKSTAETITGAKTFSLGTLLDKGEIVYDVRAFGAVGDDSTDDTAAIQSAIAAAQTNKGRVLFTQGRVYKITSTLKLYTGSSPAITAYTDIMLDLNGATIKQYTTGADFIKGLNDVANGAQSLNITIKDGTLLFGGATKTNSGNGIYLAQQAAGGPSFQQFKIERINVQDCQGSGKYAFNMESIIVSNLDTCMAVNCSNAYYLNGAVSGAYSSVSTSVTMRNCYANMNVNANNGYNILDCTYVKLDNCACDYSGNSTGTAYLVDGSNAVKLDTCGVELNGTATLTNGFKVQGGSSQVRLDTCYAYQSKSTTDVWVTGSSTGVTISNFQDNSSVSGSIGLRVDAGSQVTEVDNSWGSVATMRNILGTDVILNDPTSNTAKMAFKGTDFTLVDPTDTTKKAQFIMSSIPTGTTSSYTLPGGSGTLMTLGSTQSITGVKTFTAAPIIGTITNTGTLTLPTSTDTIVGRATTDTLTNKRITARIGTTASSSTPTANADSHDQYNVTALAANATFGAPTGTPTDGQKLTYRIKDNGTARTLAFNAIFRALGVTLPTTTVISKTLYIGTIYNAADTKWDVVAVMQEA